MIGCFPLAPAGASAMAPFRARKSNEPLAVAEDEEPPKAVAPAKLIDTAAVSDSAPAAAPLTAASACADGAAGRG
jgi:hypothetical protein